MTVTFSRALIGSNRSSNDSKLSDNFGCMPLVNDLATPFEDAARRLEELAIGAAPGDRLPAEKDLAVELGVSRLTVREAMRHLAARGLVVLSRGRRAVVREPDGEDLAAYFDVSVRRDPRRLLELLEIRRALESLSAAAAAGAASRSGLTVLTRATEEMARTARLLDEARAAGAEFSELLQDYVRADVDFHAALSVVGGNRLLATLLDGLADTLADAFIESSRGHFARGGCAAEVVDDHVAVVDAVRRGDVAGATAAMHRHLDEAGHDLRAALIGRSAGPTPTPTSERGQR